MARAVDIVRRLAPNAKPAYVTAFENGDALLAAHGITTPNRMAHLLAQILHESGGCKVEFENMRYRAPRILEIFGVGKHSARVTPAEAERLAGRPEALAERVYGLGNPRKARELGNTQPGDGFRYRGGGLLQTTGRFNYRTMGQKCGVDFEGTPTLIVSPEHALKPALAEWTAGRLNDFADADDLLAVSRGINIGNPHSSGKPNGMPDRAGWLRKVRRLLDRVDLRPHSPAAGGRVADATVGTIRLVDLIGRRVLREGDDGEAVRAVQQALVRLGLPVGVTGRFDAATKAIVTDFQIRHDLRVDGKVGRQTAAAIDTALGQLQ